MAKEVTKDEKKKQVLATIGKKFGKEAIMDLTGAAVREFPHVPTGFIGIDHVLFGIGGIPKGRIIEFFGEFSCGKSTMTLLLIAAMQRAGVACALVDVEHAMNPEYAAKLGVDVGALTFSQPDSAEEALDIVKLLAESGGYGLVVVDSLAALTPQAELESEDMGQAQVGLQARLISKALRQLAGICNKNECTLALVNQTRAKIGGMGYGPQTDTSGGNAPKFYSSVRMELKKIKQLKGKDKTKLSSEDVTVGHRIRIQTAKNKLYPPFRTVEYDLMFGEGFSREAELVDIGETFGILDKSGNTYSFEGTKVGVGRPNAILEVASNSVLQDKLYSAIKMRLKATAPVGRVSEDDEEENSESDD